MIDNINWYPGHMKKTRDGSPRIAYDYLVK